MHPAAVIAGLIADNRRARAEFLPRLLVPVFAGGRIVVKCDCDQRPDGRDMGIWSLWSGGAQYLAILATMDSRM